MKRLLTILFLVPLFISAQTLNYNGSSNPSLNGTTIHVGAGNYTSGTWQNIHDAVIDGGGVATLKGTINTDHLINVRIQNFNVWGVPGDAFVVTGNNQFVTWRHLNISGVAGAVLNASQNLPYTGTQSSLIMYFCRFDSNYVQHAGRILSGSFGAAGANTCIMDSVAIEYNYILNTTDNGIQERGSCFRLGYNYNVEMYDSLGGVNPVLGDVGTCYNNGSLTMHDNRRINSRGYLLRNWFVQLNGRADKNQIYNNVHINSHTYGLLDLESYNPPSANEEGIYTQLGGGTIYVHHNTLLNAQDNIGYWAPYILAGQFLGNGATTIIYEHNNLGAQNIENYPGHTYNTDQLGKSKIFSDQSNGSARLDSGNNRYITTYGGFFNMATGAKTGPAVTAFPNIGAEPGVVTNQPPTGVIDGVGTVITPKDTATWYSNNSSDPDGTIVSRTWAQVSGPNTAGNSTPTGSSTKWSGLIFGLYQFKLTLVDDDGGTTVVTRNLNVTNDKPVAMITATSANPVTLPAHTFSLSGTGSTSPASTVTSWSWSFVGTSPGTSFSSTTGSTTVFSVTSPGTYQVRLIVKDANGVSSDPYVYSVTASPTVVTPPPAGQEDLVIPDGYQIIYY